MRFLEGKLLPTNGTEPGAGPDRGEVPADARAFFINGAEARFTVQEHTIAIRLLREHEQVGALAERGHDSLTLQTAREFLERPAGFIRGHDFKTNEVLELHFDGHRATSAATTVTQTRPVGFPGGGAIDVELRLRHAQSLSTLPDQKPEGGIADDGLRS